MQMLNVKCIISNTLHRNSVKHRKPAQLVLISHRIFENTRIMHVFTPKCFSLSTKNNSEAASTCRRRTLTVLYYIFFIKILRNTKNSAQFLLINHKLFKTARNVLMPASKYFTLSTKNNRETTDSACRLSVLYYIIFVEILRNTKTLLSYYQLIVDFRNILNLIHPEANDA